MTGSRMPMSSILLDEAKEPLHSFLVIVMLLAFNDNLLATIDELITALHGEVFLSQELAASFELIVGSFAVLLGDTISDTTL